MIRTVLFRSGCIADDCLVVGVVRDNLDKQDDSVENHVGANTSNQTIGNGVCKRHDGNGKESRYSISHVLPIDLSHSANHHRTNKNQNASSGPWWDGRKNRGEEDGDEEADSGNHGGDTSLATFGNTSTRLDKRSNGRHTKNSADGNAESIHHVCNRGAFKILGDRIDKVGEACHTIQRTSAVKDVNIQEGDKCQTKLATVAGNVELENIERTLDLMEVDHLLEKVESVVAKSVVGEVCDIGASWPRDNTDKQDSSDNSTLDPVHHEQHGEDTTAEDTNPHGGISHLLGRRAQTRSGISVAGLATCQFQRSRSTANNEADTLAIGKTNKSQEEANTDAGGELDTTRNGTSQPLTHAEEGKTKEDEALDKNGCKSKLIGDRTRATGTDDSIGEIRIQAHSRSETDRQIGEETHEKCSQSRNGSSRGNSVALDLGNTQLISIIWNTSAVLISRANAERGEASPDLGEE
ncbi:hypothetical protein HG531_014122 [Fusarium graminearum]|nr:hypothetical protein HG531_014122 [Fusarium graminearum]